MMSGMRKAGQSWLGRIVVAVLFGFLILSFGIWGIGDMIRSVGHTNVAQVGSTEISALAYRDAYQNEMQQLSRRIRRAITNDEARAVGLDRQVLSKMMTEATLDERVKYYGLAISDATIAKAIFADPAFKGPSGQFDRNAFNDAIRNQGFTEQGFIRTQRAVYLRQQLADTVAGAPPVPGVLRDAVHRYQNETRAISYVAIGAEKAGEVPAPDAAALQTFFDQQKAAFRAPEFRKVTLLQLSPADVAKPDQVPEAEAKAFYERNKARYGEPEKRSIQQIVFPTADEAKAAAERIKGGLSFDALAEERKIPPQDLDLGVVSKDGVVDPKVAEAAFSTPAGSVSEPVAGNFGFVLVRVASIQPEQVKPFEAAAAEIRNEIAKGKARDAMQDVHDKIEDQRASAKPLADIAKDLKLAVKQVEVDRAGRDKSGKPVAIADRDSVLKAAFASDVGVDNEAVSTRDGGYVWFEIGGIEASRERKLDEVKAEVAAAWKADETANRVARIASDAVRKINAGSTLEAVAGELGLEIRTAKDLKRQGAAGGLSQAAVAQAFATPVGKVATALGASAQERLVLRIDGAETPPLLSTQQAAQQLDEQIRLALSDDMLSVYVQKVQQEIGASVNEAVLRQAIGGQF
ncbi:SurA N-terminal domain-containing protein [Alsobacter sp. KACC 23698]|uniref:Parvulin-like PPIase n=1 Tax=Alsobacter sp. KACC 23698 TaxID=3149229 RepID=A0AAU7JMH0_9HYPH